MHTVVEWWRRTGWYVILAVACWILVVEMRIWPVGLLVLVVGLLAIRRPARRRPAPARGETPR